MLWRGNAYNAESFGFILIASFTVAVSLVGLAAEECARKRDREITKSLNDFSDRPARDSRWSNCQLGRFKRCRKKLDSRCLRRDFTI